MCVTGTTTGIVLLIDHIYWIGLLSGIAYITVTLSDTLIDIIIQTPTSVSILIYYQPDMEAVAKLKNAIEERTVWKN